MKYHVQFHVMVELDAKSSIDAEQRLAEILPAPIDFDNIGKTLSRGWNTILVDDESEDKQ